MTRHQHYLVLRLRRVSRALESALASRLAAFFHAQAARVAHRYAAGHALLLPFDEAWTLYRALDPYLRAAVTLSAAAAGPSVGVTALADTDPRVQAILAHSANRVTRVTEETRRAIQRALVEGHARGDSPHQVGERLRAVVAETYRGRAQTIARTEIALASAVSAADRYEAAGITEVDVRDGAECGWTRHDDPDKANGTRRSLADFREHPLSHPNCRRVGVPVVATRR